MRKPLHLKSTALVLFTAAAILLCRQMGLAYPRYFDPALGSGVTNSYCSGCHGQFIDDKSPKGTVIPGDKHSMHENMMVSPVNCSLCHENGDNRNPFIGGGPNSSTGYNCSGCHVGAGLRLHHSANGVTGCYTAGCHSSPEASVPETVSPPYYSRSDTYVRNPSNLVKASNTNENWSIGDFIGLDNDGNNLYDAADPAVNPYLILSTAKEGNNNRITWRTAGLRKDILQASSAVDGPYTNVATITTTTNVGIINTNYLEIGGATNRARFYRIKLGL